jgi:uncharacterized membrane protein YeaQ/YmgE (transglycosylase-associated protein family)
MEFGIHMDVLGWVVLVAGALVFGVAAQLIGETRTGWEWLVDGIAAGIGALFASEFLVAARTMEPVFYGLALVPALVGGLVLGVIVEVVTRYGTGGSYAGRPTTA